LLQAFTRIVTGRQMDRIDHRAIEGGIPGSKLMQTAGEGVFKVLESVVDGLNGRRIAILCGKGNNGGDGFVVGTLAQQKGAEVSTFLFAGLDQIKGDARHHLEATIQHGLSVNEIRTQSEFEGVTRALFEADVVIDALLGTGIKGSPTGHIARAIDKVNQTECPVISVDVPSGLDAQDGNCSGPCINADHTVTFALPKLGHFFQPGRSHCGRIHLVDIGISNEDVLAEGIDTSLIAPNGAAPLLPLRAPDAHKGDCGRVVIIAGSHGLTGAAALAGRAATRAGAGLVTVGVPESLNDILEIKLTEAMTRPLPEVRKARCLALRSRGQILGLIQSVDCVALGPGLGRHRETEELIRRLLRDIQVPLIIDADALNALAGDLNRLRELETPTIVTPHPGEFCALTGVGMDRIRSNPIEEARKLAESCKITVVLKGSPTLVAAPDGSVYVNPSGNAGMATGGTGDVLTGVLAALIAQGLDTLQAAQLGTYLHGLAGDLAVETTGQLGLTAGDIVEHLPASEQMIRKLEDRSRYITREFH
jgi:hydroxyethylthiazole kinase-like uncharacterized protein yjeF